MARNIFTDSLSDAELMNSLGIQQDNAPLTPEELQALSQEQEIIAESPVVQSANPVTPKKTSRISSESQNPYPNIPGVPDIDKLMAGLPKDSPNTNNNTDNSYTPITRQEALLEEYMRLSGKEGTDELKAAREQDRALKIGGALADVLGTYVNAQRQRRAMIPGVEVKPSTDASRLTGMFETAPEVASDLAARREALLAQYTALAKGQQGDLSKSPNAWQIIPVVKDGVQQYVSVNKVTNEVRPIGEKATYQQFRIDPNTGLVEAYNPIAGVKSSSGMSMSPSPTTPTTKQEKVVQDTEKNINQLVKETRSQLNPKQKELIENTIKDFNKDTKDERNTIGSISSLRKTLEMSSDNRAAARAFGTQLAKVFQDGRLSDKDVDLYIKDTDLVQKIRTGYFDMVKGTIDPDKIPEYRQLISSMEQGLIDNINTKADFFATQRLGTFIENPEIRRELIYPKQTMEYIKSGSNKPDQKQSISNTIVRKDRKSGRMVEYDAETKKPIRFLD